MIDLSTTTNIQQTMPRSLMSEKSHPFFVGAIMLFGGFLRLYHLGFKSLWLDEAVMFWISQGSIGQILAQNADLNSAPPLYPILLHLISYIGQSEAVLRFLSWLPGVIAIPAIYVLARRFMSFPAALFAAFLMAVAPVQLRYSQELREYSLAVLLSIAMVFFALEFMQNRDRRTLLIFFAVSAVSLFTQYGLALLLVGINLVFFVDWTIGKRDKQILLQWVVVQVALLGVVAIVYWIALRHQMVSGGFGAFYLSSGYWTRTEGLLGGLPEFVFTNTLRILKFFFPVRLAIWAPIILLGLFGFIRSPQSRKFTMIMTTTGMVVVVMAALHLYPYIPARQTLFLSPLVYLFLGIGLNEILKVRMGWIVALLLVGVFGFYGIRESFIHLQKPSFEDLRPIVQTLQESIEPGDRIYLYYNTNPAFRYYYRRPENPIILGSESRIKPELYLQELNDHLKESGRIWFVFTHCVLGECERIPNEIREIREIDLVQSNTGAWLYLAP